MVYTSVRGMRITDLKMSFFFNPTSSISTLIYSISGWNDRLIGKVYFLGDTSIHMAGSRNVINVASKTLHLEYNVSNIVVGIMR